MMGYEPFYSPNRQTPVRSPKTGELLFEFYRERDHKFHRCELRDHGRYGMEAQFYEGGDFLRSRRFDPSLDRERSARELAIAWAIDERAATEKGGA